MARNLHYVARFGSVSDMKCGVVADDLGTVMHVGPECVEILEESEVLDVILRNKHFIRSLAILTDERIHRDLGITIQAARSEGHELRHVMLITSYSEPAADLRDRFRVCTNFTRAEISGR